jgi:hypothetical protein
MRDELDKLLCNRYPKIFEMRHGNVQDTAMCWGIECGDGWFNLIDELCANIQNYIDQNPHKQVPQVVAEQIKEKFGTLRFYVHGGDQLITGMIWFAEGMSARVCETCGNPGKRQGQGWIYTACDSHTKTDQMDNNNEREN